MLKTSIIACVCFVLFLVTHGITFHFVHHLEAKTRSIIVTFLVMVPIYVLIYALTPSDPLSAFLVDTTKVNSPEWLILELINFIMGLLFYGFLFLGYLEFYFTADRSMTCRMLVLLDEFPEQRMTENDFLEHYDTDRIIRRRLDDMTWGGYLAKKGQLTQQIYGAVIKFLNLGKF